MITVEEAILKVHQNTSRTKNVISVKLSEALGCVLATSIFSPINMPPFRQSAMDGYAVHWNPMKNNYQLVGEVAAGSSFNPDLEPGQAIRIFTGAMVPDKANTVVKQEIVNVHGGEISFSEHINENDNIRPVGEQVKCGDLALKEGTELTPARIGFLASLGLVEVQVYRKPTVSILATGNELVEPGKDLVAGQVYESNTIMLTMALKKLGVTEIKVVHIPDDREQTKEQLEKTLSTTDILLVSGGISVGDYDFVGEALLANGVEEIFYKVKQKPGKPLFFGKKSDKLIFALPGNPAAAMTGFYIYVLPAIHKILGKQEIGLRKENRRITNDFSKRGDRAVFLKAMECNEAVEILEAQASSMLSSFAMANALVYLPSDINEVKSGQTVITYMLE